LSNSFQTNLEEQKIDPVYHNSSQVVPNLANRHRMNGICCSYVHRPIIKHDYLTARSSWMSVHHAPAHVHPRFRKADTIVLD